MKKISLVIVLITLESVTLYGQESDSTWNQLEWLNQEYIIDDFQWQDIKRVNLNGDRLTELLKLSFITYSDIEQILLYREYNGGFINVLELSRVSGFSIEKFKQLQPFVEVIPKDQWIAGKKLPA
jgi:DNA uptake protein ComE-like DNA-binding protein